MRVDLGPGGRADRDDHRDADDERGNAEHEGAQQEHRDRALSGAQLAFVDVRAVHPPDPNG